MKPTILLLSMLSMACTSQTRGIVPYDPLEPEHERGLDSWVEVKKRRVIVWIGVEF